MKSITFDAWVVTRHESGCTSYMTETSEERNIRVWSRKPEKAILIRKPSIADELVRKLKTVWYGSKLGVEKITRSEIR
jgi:hypothetical protein